MDILHWSILLTYSKNIITALGTYLDRRYFFILYQPQADLIGSVYDSSRARSLSAQNMGPMVIFQKIEDKPNRFFCK